ncbi:hypothetical protein ACSAZL_16785 [Methanosarcina sp. T3]|uniref:hypothetical protein n=1 Tax=Methanosarcina sp. T3 TaxID=3439062 RepID=UPI003F86BAF1
MAYKNYKHIILFYIIGVEGTKVEGTKETIKALIDLTRAHFSLVWVLLFYSGLALAIKNYGEFSREMTFKAVFIGLFGFEGGLVLNDYVDRKRDRLDVEGSLTAYWRPFKSRPLPSGRLSPGFCPGTVPVILCVNRDSDGDFALPELPVCVYHNAFLMRY